MTLIRTLLLAVLLCPPLAAAPLPGGMPLTPGFAEDLLEDALRHAGSVQGARFEVMVEHPRLPLGNQETASTDIVVRDLRHDEATGRFSAVLEGMIDDQPRFQLPIHGRAEAKVELPVLIRALAPGEMITSADIDYIEVQHSRISTIALTDPAQLVGAEARRRLSAGRVLTENDLGPPRLVRKGKPVRVVYSEGALKLTALGTARDDGAFGEPVRVVNAATRQQIQGVATGPDEVTIGGLVMPGAGL